ncbi:MAG: hypothetical protein H6508_03825 [Calditrichaeota bacterium]|nr:hypothetical protein [Calditrichota bacterium]MCB9366301.1 hypothetical protein [Calditrichota bacterium]
MIRLLLLSCLIWAGTAIGSRQADYLTYDFGRFAVTCCPEDSGLAARLVTDLEQRLPDLQRRLGLAFPDSVRFVITPSADEWGRVTAGSPLWANGIAYPAQGVAVLKSPRFNMNGGGIGETAAHELVHLLLSTGAGAGFPRWFEEGLAQFMAGQQEYLDTQVLARAAASGRLMRFWDIQGLMGMNPTDARQGYAQSLLAMEDLQGRYGDSGLSNLVHSVRNGRDFDESFLTLFGQTSGQFESNHLALIRDRYGAAVWTDGELLVSILFVVLVFAAGAFAFLKRRRTLARWHQEQHMEDQPPREVPYVVNYTLVRERLQDNGEDAAEGIRPDRPQEGN